MGLIKFDPNDQNTRSFLMAIDVPEDVINGGLIDLPTAMRMGMNLNVFMSVAAANDLEDDTFISSGEAKKVLDLIKYREEGVLALFRENRCPGGGVSADSILSKMLGGNFNHILEGKVELENLCPYDPTYTADEQRGIHFTEDMVPKWLKKVGDAVALVAMKSDGVGWQGSAEIISKNGDIATAYHVLYDEIGKFRDKVLIRVSGHVYEIKETDVVETINALDFAKVRLDLKVTPRPIPIAKRPPSAGDTVWIVSFPSQHGDSMQRTYTPGRVKEVLVDLADGSTTIVTTALATVGNSGGVMVNDSGEMVAVVSAIDIKGKLNVLLSNPDASIGYMPGELYLDPPETIRKKLEGDWGKIPSAK